MSDLDLFADYAKREEVSVEEARQILIEQMQDYDSPEDFLDDICFEHDYLLQVVEYWRT